MNLQTSNLSPGDVFVDIFLHLYTQHRLQATWRPVHTTTATFLNILLLEIWELARVVFFINLQRKNVS